MIIKKAEQFFGMPFSEIINVLHLKEKISLNELSKRSGISRQSLAYSAKRLGLKIRSVQEATKLTPNKGDKHFAYGKRKEFDSFAKMHSDRMKKNNPIKNKISQEKRAKSMSRSLIKMNLPQENKFSEILNLNEVEYERQSAFGPYNLDFYLPSFNLAIEIDSTSKWGKKRKVAAKKRDSYMLTVHGIKTLRINKDMLYDSEFIINILKTNDII